MRLALRLMLNTGKLIDHYSQFQPSALSIQQFIDFGTKNASPKNSFMFLRKELPVRLANIMKEIHLLPEQLLNMPSVRLVEKWYVQSFHEILEFEKSTADDETVKRFSETLDNVRNRHGSVVETMAEGIKEMKDHGLSGDVNLLDSRVQYFLDRFYMSRISMRMLIHQHLLLFGKLDKNPHHVGCIDPSCDVLAVAEDAYENARFLCDQYYMNAPLCKFKSHLIACDNSVPNKRIVMTYVPSHLYHMLFELFKNSMRAVVEFYGEDKTLPEIAVLISKGREDVTIKLSDEGGGIRRSDLESLFNYMYSTAPKPPSPDAIITTPLAGYGYGLPLSRLYAKYFNGDLWLNSVDGFGTDAMIALKLFPCDASELLPIYNKTSSLKYTSSAQVGDWSDMSQGPSSKDDSGKRRVTKRPAQSTTTGDLK